MKNSIILILLIIFSITSVISQNEWNEQNSGTNKFLTDVFFVDQNNGWTGTILSTSDGGVNWNPQSPPPNNAYEGLFFTDDQTGWAVGYGGKIIHTVDGGTTWDEQLSGTQFYLLDVQFIDANKGWIAGGRFADFNVDPVRQILFTNDGGSTWTSQLLESDFPPLRSIHIVNETNGYAVGESGKILKTTNGGQNWTEIMSDQQYHLYGVEFVNQDSGWVVGQDLSLDHLSVIFNTTDGGENWDLKTFGADESLQDVCFTDDMQGWAVGGTSISAIVLNTIDGGETWNYQETGTAGALSSVCFVDEDFGWAAGYNGTIIHTGSTVGLEETPDVNRDLLNAKIFPMPFTNSATIEYFLDNPSKVVITFHNQMGRLVEVISQNQLSGKQQVQWNTEQLPSGMYYYTIQAGNQMASGKVLKHR